MNELKDLYLAIYKEHMQYDSIFVKFQNREN